MNEIIKQIVALLLRLFVMRSDVYARQTENGRYLKAEAPLTEMVIEGHLNGEQTVGTYQLKGSRVKWVCFDVDILKAEIKKLESSGKSRAEVIEIFRPKITECTRKIVDELLKNGYGSAIAVEFSGGKGMHVWVFVEECEASIAKRFGEKVLKAIGKVPEGLAIELFPKQTDAKAKYGSTVKIPLGTHAATGWRSNFFDPITFEHTDESIGVEEFWMVQRNILEAIVPANLNDMQVSDSVKDNNYDTFLSEVSSTGAPALLEKATESCNWFKNKIAEAKSNEHLNHDDRVAAATNLLQFGNKGAIAVNCMMLLCKDYNYEKTNEQIKYFVENKYNPTSCKKLCPEKQCEAIKLCRGRNPADLIKTLATVGDEDGRHDNSLADWDSAASVIHTIRQNRGFPPLIPPLKEFEVNNDVARLIFNFLNKQGKYYTDEREVYFFNDKEKELIKVSREDNNFLIMLGHLGLYPSENVHKYVNDYMFLNILEDGIKTEIYNMSYYDRDNYILYLTTFSNQVYRVTADCVELVDNGTDGVLFVSDPANQPFFIDETPRQAPGNSLFEDLIISKINFIEDSLSADERKIIFKFWFYSIFFGSIMPTKPLLAFIGEWGSGKTITLRKIGLLLFGKRFEVMPLTQDQKDFDSAITNSDYVAVDNADTKTHWFEDRLAIVATGGSIKKRELYTTNRLISYPVRCFLAITSRTPFFRREDIASRMLLMKVGQFEKYESENKLLAEIIDNRNSIMMEVIFHLQTIIRALYESRDIKLNVDFRMTDFADFAFRIARYSGEENEVKALFKKLSGEQNLFSLEGDPTIELLNIWVETNANREVTSTQLCTELSAIAKRTNVKFPYEGQAKSFAQWLPKIIPSLEECFTISQRTASGRKKLYKFEVKNDGGDDNGGSDDGE